MFVWVSHVYQPLFFSQNKTKLLEFTNELSFLVEKNS